MRSPAWLAENLCCPHCRGALRQTTYSCVCLGGQCGRGFHIVHDQPILIDFKNSVADERQIRETSSWLEQPEPNAFHARVRSWLWGKNDVADRQAQRILDMLKDNPAPVLLIVGGGAPGSGTSRLYRDGRVETIGFDIFPSPVTRFVADAHQIPLRDGCVDAVWVQAVLEHVVCPEQVVSEIHRVLKPAGLVYSDTPFLQQVHGAAWDFTRFTESGHRWLFRRFERLDSGVVAGSGTALVSSIRHAAWGATHSRRASALVAAAFFWLRFLDRLIPEAFAMDAASSFFFLGRKTERPLGPREIIEYYRHRRN